VHAARGPGKLVDRELTRIVRNREKTLEERREGISVSLNEALPLEGEVQAELRQRDEEAPVGNVVERSDGKVTTGVGPTFRCSACSSENAACFSRKGQMVA
jgi:hypothetical protein